MRTDQHCSYHPLHSGCHQMCMTVPSGGLCAVHQPAADAKDENRNVKRKHNVIVQHSLHAVVFSE